MLKNIIVWILKYIGCASWPRLQKDKKKINAEEQMLHFEFLLY